MTNRVCILCTPRSGSQWCAKLINDVYDLGEYFEQWNQNYYQLDHHKYISLVQQNHIKHPFAIAQNYQTRCDLLYESDRQQPLVLRLFVMDHYSKNTLADICQQLQQLGFEFIKLSRLNARDQILSYAIARSCRDRYKKNIFTINSVINDRIIIDAPTIAYTVKILKPSIKNFHDNVNKIINHIPLTSVRYEYMIQDIQQIHNHSLQYIGQKTTPINPAELIINYPMVSKFIDRALE